MAMTNMNSESPSIVFTADLHFDETGAWKHRGITGDACDSFAQIVDFCCAHQAGVLALGGDIVDRPSTKQRTVKFLCDQIDLLQGAGVQVIYILGQHDGREEWPSLHPNAIHLHGRAYDVDEFTICGLDHYRRPGEFLAAYAALQVPPGSFLLCHQGWRELMGGKEELMLADLPFALDLLCGDYHDHCTRHYKARDGSHGILLSPGSTHARDVTEENGKQFFAIYRGTATPYAYRSISLRTRPVQRYWIRTVAEADAFLARQDLPLDGTGLERAVIDVSFYSDIDGFAAQLERALATRCHLFLKPRDRRREERTPSAVARRTIADRGLAGAVDLVCEPGPVRDSAKRLLEAIDAGAELAVMRKEFYDSTDSGSRGG
jgi:hypothetical protein